MKPSLALIGVFSSLWGVACGVFISTGLPTPIRTGMGVALALLGWVTGFVFGYARGHRRAILHLTSRVRDHEARQAQAR
jgi:hypothetical protein